VVPRINEIPLIKEQNATKKHERLLLIQFLEAENILND
jgi:hypothetical protein